MSEPLYDITVTDRKSFIKFLELLHQDYLTNESEWKNNTLDRFLEALPAYAKAIQAVYDNTNQDINADIPSWKVFADILRGTKIYE